MKTTQPSNLKSVSSPLPSLRNTIRVISSALGWASLLLATLLTGYFSGWVLLAAIRLGRVPVDKVIIPWLVILAITCGLAWLVARFVASLRRVGWVIGAMLVVILVAWMSWSWMYPDRALFLARQIAWGESALTDYELFPQRTVSNAAPAFHFKEEPSPALFHTITYLSEGERKEMDFEEFLQSTQTVAFIVIENDTLRYEGYFNGYARDSLLVSFSTAKSFTSALVGVALEEGYLESVNDPVIRYLPELKDQGLDEVTLRDLLMMSSGIRFLRDDEQPPLLELTQFTDEGLAYTYPNMHALMREFQPDGETPGTVFNYNNYNTILLGMILERATGQSISEYLQEKIWKPLGMEYPASWSLDSEESGFEMVASGLNARAIDFAKFGRLFLNNGNWNGTQVIPQDWVIESTSPDPNDQRSWHSDTDWKEANGYYKYQWWGRLNADGTYDYTALGHLGQFIFVAPQKKMVIVRFGLDEGGVDDWMSVFQTIAAQVNAQTMPPLTDDWRTADGDIGCTPEEQGFDSAKLAEGLLAIQEKHTAIHSLMILRNDQVILDAYFYPYDGSIYHDLASVTKSVMTTLIGIAIDQGKLSLDDSLLSFFPERAITNRDARKEAITVRHLVSMSSGLSCGRENDEPTLDSMRASDDWVQFALDRKVIDDPGTYFGYCGLGMHLLSAILQEATGVTALEFARENLFEPLGIQDVYWPADPQGVTHGWGDLALYPRDMAKLGALFLHQGEWEGQRIVSRAWVESALQGTMKGTGRVEDYGYGWWIGQPENEPEFLATGNGGQKIKVYPRLNLIIVMTGGGFEYVEIERYVTSAIGDVEKPLPANPAGVASLNTALMTIVQSPPSEPVPPLPTTAHAISDQTFVFEPNNLGLLSLRLAFDHTAEAIFQLEMANEPGPRIIVVGLDGVYRSSHAGRPILARGGWIDEQTFLIDYNEGPGLASYTLQIYFEGDFLTLEVSGLGSFEAEAQDN